MEVGGGVSVSPAVRAAVIGLRVDSVTVEVVTALRNAGIRTLLLKGPSTAAWLYGDGAVRPYDDTDLLVAPASYRAAEGVLRELGFSSLAYSWHHASETWRRVPGASYVDLHRSLIGAQAPPATVWKELAGDTDSLSVGGIEVEVLSVRARAMHVALHAAQHGVGVQVPLEDLARALRVADERLWSEAAALARRIDALPAFAAGLRLIPEGAPLARRLGLPAAPPPAAVTLRAGSAPPVAVALDQLGSEPSARARARLLLRALFPSRLYMRHWAGLHMAGRAEGLRHTPFGLGLAYLSRPLWILPRLPKAINAVRVARRSRAGAISRDDRRQPRRERNQALLAIEGLGRRFGDRDVIDSLSLTVEAGERVALRGPNGSGKTTVLRCVIGTVTPTRGRIRVGEHPAGSVDARRLVGASLSQERSFYMRLSGHANLLCFARLRGDSKAEAGERVRALEQELEIDGFTQRRADTYSAGMLQQLAFARALLGEPELLLLDEPTRSLDDEAVDRFWRALDRRPRTAVLLATHNHDDLAHCGDRIDLPT